MISAIQRFYLQTNVDVMLVGGLSAPDHPAGGETIIVFIEFRDYGFRVTITTDEVVIVIDIW